MIKDYWELLKNPVTVICELSENETLKKGAIKTLILSAIFAVLKGLNTILYIFTSKYYEHAEKWDIIKHWGILEEMFKTFWLNILVILGIALVLFLIAKLIKVRKKYEQTLCMVTNSYFVYVPGYIVAFVFSFIYTPISVLLSIAVLLYAFLTLTVSYKKSLGEMNANHYVLATTITLILILGCTYFMAKQSMITLVFESFKELMLF